MGPTVLYVEDENNDAFFMRRAFQKAGLEHSLRIVEDGQQAMDYLSGGGNYSDRSQHPLPSVVLLDLNLPVFSGFEVLEWVRQQTELRGLPIVVFSSSTRAEDRRKAHELGANEYVQKPSSAQEFPQVVQLLKDLWLAGRPGSSKGLEAV